MQIKNRNIDELIPADYNPRKKSDHVIESIKASLHDHGFLAPVVVNTHPGRENIIVGGHRRLEAARQEGLTEVPTVEVNLPIEKEKQLNLRLNAQEEFDKKGLSALISELHALDEDSVKTIGFNARAIADFLYSAKYNKGSANGVLAEKFLIPPFSVFDSKQGYWQDRKKAWLEVIGDRKESRAGKLAKGDKNVLMQFSGGVSSFDPVLVEVLYSWFNVPKGSIVDPFAGGPTAGAVASILGYDFTGIEIRPEQVEVNRTKIAGLGSSTPARYINGSSTDEATVPAGEQFDLLFSCPPYYDLEQYSDAEKDLSHLKTYADFLAMYEKALATTAAHLKDNRFAVLMVGDVRDEHGAYRNFVSDTIAIMLKLGFTLYNEIIYLQALATAPHRAERAMRKRKTVKVHQNVLTFYQGDPAALTNPALLTMHDKVLTFYRGTPEQIAEAFPNQPPIERDLLGDSAPDEEGFDEERT